MAKPPASGKPHKKVVDGKEYHWCPKHNSWGRHLPEDCQGKGIKPKPKSNEKSKEIKLNLNQSLANMVAGDDSDEE